MSFARFRLLSVMLTAAATVLIVPPAQGAPAQETLRPLTDVSAQRVLVADKVAAAKFGTPAPIDDPAREQVVLDNVRNLSVQLGIDPEVSVAIFADQIEANKVVQRGLYALWTAHPELIPTEKPDLVKEVRPILDRITADLLEQIKATQNVRAHPACGGVLNAARHIVSHQRHLDDLHTTALTRALPSVCR